MGRIKLYTQNLADLLTYSFNRPPASVALIRRIVARKLAPDLRKEKGRSRALLIEWAKIVAIYLSCELTKLSPKEIGRRFGGLDPARVLRARDSIRTRLESDDVALHALIEELRELIEARRLGKKGAAKRAWIKNFI